MWMRFLEDYDWRTRAFTVAYRKGMTLNIPKRAAEKAIDAKKAVPLTRNPDGTFEEVK